jgi:hypothetical protein|nr:MAG TPA: hypothetical protein [Caudoviricetes sp.]
MGAIGLNPIRLDAIGLDPIRFNAIRLGVPGASSATDRPYISPDVLSALAGVWIADGKSNTDPDRNIIKNKLPGRGGDFELLNFAYKLNSGYGKYEEDFTAWGRDASELLDVRPDKVIISDVGGINSYRMIIWKGNTHTKAFKAKVTGIPRNGRLIYSYAQNEGDALTNISIDNDGVYEFPYSYGFTKGHGFLIDSGTELEDWIGCTIEFIPSLQGSLCTDGVNDMIVSQNPVSEMLDGSKELTVVSMMCQISDTSDSVNRNNWLFTPTSYLESKIEKGKTGKTGIYGYTSTDIRNGQISNVNTILGDKNDYIANSLLDSTGLDYFSVEGFNNQGIWYTSSVAWYWTFIAKRALTTDEINQVIAYYNLDKYVKPDILCDVKRQGITNENHAEFGDQLIDFVGGHNIQLNNIGWEGESGIIDGALYLDGISDFGKATGLPILKDYTVVADREFLGSKSGSIVSKSHIVSNGAFIFETFADKSATTSFGSNTLVDISDFKKISYQSKYIYNGNPIQVGIGVDGDSMCLGVIRENDSRFSKFALWSLLLFPYSLSEFLLERQLKKHKLGTLYPGMVEFRPIVKSNIPYSSISYSANPGEYVIEGSTVTITITLSNSSDKLVDISSNAISDMSISGDNGVYEVTGKVTKSPQKINIVISSYLTMLDNETLISNETLIKNE